MVKNYLPKKDPLFVWVTLGVLFMVLFFFLLSPQVYLDNLWLLAIMILTPAPLIWMFYQTGYQLNENILKYKCGPLSGIVDVMHIRSIKPNDSYWYAGFKKAALSKDGLIIRYNKYDELFIAPENKEEFINDILSINPEIEIKK